MKMVQEVKKVSTNVVLCVCCDGERRRGCSPVCRWWFRIAFFLHFLVLLRVCGGRDVESVYRQYPTKGVVRPGGGVFKKS